MATPRTFSRTNDKQALQARRPAAGAGGDRGLTYNHVFEGAPEAIDAAKAAAEAHTATLGEGAVAVVQVCWLALCCITEVIHVTSSVNLTHLIS